MNDKTVQQPRRIFLAIESRLLRGMLKQVIEKAPGLVVVGETTGSAGLTSRVEETGAEWVVVSLLRNGAMPDLEESLLTSFPSLRVLSVSPDGSQVKMKWMEVNEVSLNDLLIDGLASVLRSSRPWNQEDLIDYRKEQEGL